MAKKEVEFIEVEEDNDYSTGQSAIFISIWIGIILLCAFNLDKIADVVGYLFGWA